MLWEISTRQLPYEHLKNSWDVAAFVLGGGRPDIDPICPMCFASLMTVCWDKDPLQRKPFAEIVPELERLLECVQNAE